MKYPLCFAFGMAVLLGGCSQSNEKTEYSALKREAVDASPSANSPSVDSEGLADATAEVSPSPKPLTEPVVAPSRLLVYHADLRLKVDNLPRASASLDSLVHRNSGYLSASTEVREDGEWRQAMTIRVAPARFRPLMTALSGLSLIHI